MPKASHGSAEENDHGDAEENAVQVPDDTEDWEKDPGAS